MKHNSDGSVDRCKERLVAKGYTQKYGVDYDEKFAPVAKINTIRVLLSLATNLDWPLQQFDVKNPFLHEDLDERGLYGFASWIWYLYWRAGGVQIEEFMV